MKSDQTLSSKRTEIQESIITKVVGSDGHGLMILPTGVGKTRCAIETIIRLHGNNDPKILWVVPTTMLRDKTIPEEWKKWGYAGFFKKHVTVICYRSLHKETSFYDHIVLDEGHNITALTMQAPTFTDSRYGNILLMTATYPSDLDKRLLIADMGLEVIANMSLNKAVELGLVAPFNIKVYPVMMDTAVDYKVSTKRGSYVTSEQTYYSKITASINRFGPGQAPRQMYLRRMHAIYRFKSKVRAAKVLLDRIPDDQRVLIFCGSIDVAKQLCKHQYHSKTSDEAYKMFNSGKINRLAVVKSLNEGHNMVNVDRAVIVQTDSNQRNYIQRQGRAIRWRPGHKAKIIILYSWQTVDYRWVQKSLDGIDSKYIDYYSKIIKA